MTDTNVPDDAGPSLPLRRWRWSRWKWLLVVLAAAYVIGPTPHVEWHDEKSLWECPSGSRLQGDPYGREKPISISNFAEIYNLGWLKA